MNNKRGGAGAKIILVLILMIASAVGGAYGYRVLDGKLAVREAKNDIEAVRISDYEAPESTEVQALIDNLNKELDNTKTRKQVYELVEDFNSDIAKIQTKAQKELAAARKEAEEARNRYNDNNNNNNINNNNTGNNGSGNYNNSDNNGSNADTGDYNNGGNEGNYTNDNSTNDTATDTGEDNSMNTNNSSSDTGDNNSGAISNDDGSSGRSGLLDSLLGGDD